MELCATTIWAKNAKLRPVSDIPPPSPIRVWIRGGALGFAPLVKLHRTLYLRAELHHFFVRHEPLETHQLEAKPSCGAPEVIKGRRHLSVPILEQLVQLSVSFMGRQ